eukprot:NODE_181_length_15774_cov_0.163892.p3 type:complete len:439 gc:universal NODE_181_length_15774_cov_0.163892:12149-10833(-)
MYNGRSLENIQEVCRNLVESESELKTYESFSELRKHFIEQDLMNLLDDTEMSTMIPGDAEHSRIDSILSEPTGTEIEYVEVTEAHNTIAKRNVSALRNSKAVSKEKESKSSSFKSAGATNKENKIEDQFLKEIDPTGKFTAIISSLIVDISDKLTFEDIAGLDKAKQLLRETVIYPMLRPDIFTGIRSPVKGILLFGPPGTGKTFLAKVAACECKSTFFSISASSITSKWIGESEKLVRALFAVAKLQQPSIIFIDEIDSLLSARGGSNEGESADNLRGLKTELLVQLDGMSSKSNDQILVIAATNRPQSLDEAARRRFTKRIYVGLPNPVAREQIVRLQLKDEKHSLKDEDFKKIVDSTNKFSCSDVKELVRTAAGICIRELGSKIQDFSFQVPPISMNDFLVAINEVNTSVSEKDVAFHLAWNAQFGSNKEIEIDE